ncbi:MAG: VanZ family protein [Erysipelotrichaceae bacterium]
MSANIKNVSKVLLSIYILGVIYFTLFWKGSSFSEEYNLQLNLIPLYWLLEPILVGKDFYLDQVILNIIMFVPLGALLPIIIKKCSVNKILLIGMASSLSIELVQPFFNRCSDIDDLILNILGALIGFYCFKVYANIKSCRLLSYHKNKMAHI